MYKKQQTKFTCKFISNTNNSCGVKQLGCNTNRLLELRKPIISNK